jgi:hypothetical protein
MNRPAIGAESAQNRASSGNHMGANFRDPGPACSTYGCSEFGAGSCWTDTDSGPGGGKFKHPGGWKSRQRVDRYAKFASGNLMVAASRIETVRSVA